MEELQLTPQPPEVNCLQAPDLDDSCHVVQNYFKV